MTNSFWQSRRVFVTGHTGFKGAWLCLLLQRLGARVHGFSLPPPTEPSLFEIAGVARQLERDERGDVRDLTALTAAMRAARAEVVIHMAAQPLVRESYTDPVGTYATNVMGTVNFLEALRTVGSDVKAAVVVTTDKCYENREWAWGYREDEPMGGHDPYSSSKGCAELVTAAYRRSYFHSAGATSVASGRAGNVIGGGDWAKDRLIPDMIKAFAAGAPAIIRNPNSIRPWQHVLEPLAGYLTLAEKLAGAERQTLAEAWNFGPFDDDARPVQWIAERLAKLWGDRARWELSQDSTAQPHEAYYLKLDTSKARSRLGWRPRTDLATALEWIVTWYKCWTRGDDMLKISLAQIERFLEQDPSS
jgi:CDP-glucose 4,6-dehydratase